MQEIDLTGGRVKLLGNKDDTHTFRLSNPAGQPIIESGVEYEAEFESSLDKVTSVSIDTTQREQGILTFPVTINNGVYRVRRLNPRRTILVVEVEVR